MLGKAGMNRGGRVEWMEACLIAFSLIAIKL